jgi:hypothetical protein
MFTWQRLNGNLFPALAACCLGAVLVLGPASTGAADPIAPDSKGVSGVVEQSPEQAAGGRENLKRLKKACGTDAKRLCKDVRPGGGHILQCLREHESDLSAGCREVAVLPAAKP